MIYFSKINRGLIKYQLLSCYLLLSSKPTTPRLAVNIRFGMHINENVEPVLSLVPRSKGSRIAQYVETSNAESPTMMYRYNLPH